MPAYYFTKPLDRRAQQALDVPSPPGYPTRFSYRTRGMPAEDAPAVEHNDTTSTQETAGCGHMSTTTHNNGPMLRMVVKKVRIRKSQELLKKIKSSKSPWCRASKVRFKKVILFVDNQGNAYPADRVLEDGSLMPEEEYKKLHPELEEEEKEEMEEEEKTESNDMEGVEKLECTPDKKSPQQQEDKQGSGSSKQEETEASVRETSSGRKSRSPNRYSPDTTDPPSTRNTSPKLSRSASPQARGHASSPRSANPTPQRPRSHSPRVKPSPATFTPTATGEKDKVSTAEGSRGAAVSESDQMTPARPDTSVATRSSRKVGT